MDLLTAAADLFLGARCVGCGAPSTSICSDCAAAIWPDPVIVRQVPCTVAAAGPYETPLREVIIAWKERGHFTLERPLSHLIAASVVALDVPDRVTLVPVPSRPGRRRARGADVVRDVAKVAAAALCRIGMQVRVEPVLRVTGRVRDQAGLAAAARAVNVRGAFAVGREPAGPVVIVDDVVTTGATIAEAQRVLAGRGIDVIGAAVAAGAGLWTPEAIPSLHGDRRQRSEQRDQRSLP